MGNSKTLLISIVLTGFAILLVMTYVDQMESDFSSGLGTMVQVLVTNRDIREDTLLEASMFKTAKYPKKYVQPNFLKNSADVQGTVAAVPMAKGETVTTTKLVFLGEKTGLAPIISKGKRAVTINAIGVGSDLLKPGNRIDLLAVIPIKNSDGTTSPNVKTVLQDLLVIAVGANMMAGGRKFKKARKGDFPACVQKKSKKVEDEDGGSIIVEVTPKEAQTLVVLGRYGLYYTLRNPVDRQFQVVTPTTDKEILNNAI